MNRTAWPLIEIASKFLDHDEREAVIGDLFEIDESSWKGFLDISGLVLRRQANLWKAPQPWLAGLITLPCSYLLMYVSLSVTCTYQRLVTHKNFGWDWPTGNEGYPLLLCHIFLLIAWSWSGGYIVGSASRRTLWASAALALLPSVFHICMISSQGLMASPPLYCAFLFLLPAAIGVRHGLRNTRISLRAASLLAFVTTVLMISAWTSQALWLLNWTLLLPVWYLVAIVWQRPKDERTVASSL